MSTNWHSVTKQLLNLFQNKKNDIENMSINDFLILVKKNTDINIDDIKNGKKDTIRLFKNLITLMGYRMNDVISSYLKKNDLCECQRCVEKYANNISKRVIRNTVNGMDVSTREQFIRESISNGTFDNFLSDCVKGKGNMKTNDIIDYSDNGCDDDDENSMNVISALKVENKKLKKQVEKNRISNGDDQLLLERIEESINKVLPDLKYAKEVWSGDKTFKKNEQGTAVLHISDWHIGSCENVDGFNVFNYDVACKRVKMLTNKYISWTKMHRAMYNINELVIIATGDMISGDIHEELLRTNEFSVPEQCVKAASLIAKLASSLSPFFNKVRIEYIVADNHSRTTKKIQFGDGKNSYNYIVGYMSQLLLKSVKNIEFNLYPEIQKIIKVENMRYLITHGNCVRGGFAGIPFYSMQRKVGAEASVRMNMGEAFHFDKIVMGHYHVPIRSTQYEMTGCLSSTTAFDQSAGRHCRACQTGWIVSKDNEIDYYELWLS